MKLESLGIQLGERNPRANLVEDVTRGSDMELIRTAHHTPIVTSFTGHKEMVHQGGIYM